MQVEPHVKAIEKAGGPSALAKELKCAPQAISQWRQIPTGRLIEVERITGIPREELRPDLYRAPEPTPAHSGDGA